MASGFVKAELTTCRQGRPQVSCRLLYKSVLLLVFGLIPWKWTNGVDSLDGAWYCTNCKADCGLCSGAVLKGHKAVRCDSCDMWIHNECSFIAETQYEIVNNTNCTWICPKCEFFNFSDSFFGEQVNLETENRFVPLTKRRKIGLHLVVQIKAALLVG